MKKKNIIIVAMAVFFLVAAGFYFVLLRYGFIQADVSPLRAILTLSGGGQKNLQSNFDVTVNLNSNGNRVCVVDLNLTYPSSILTLNASPTLLTPFSLATIQDSGTPGQVHYQIGATGCTTRSGGILKLNFKAQKVGQGDISFGATALLGGDDGQLEILANASGTNVSITSQQPTPGETAAPTPSVNPTNEEISSSPPEAIPPPEAQTPATSTSSAASPSSGSPLPTPLQSPRSGIPAPEKQSSAAPTEIASKKNKYITWILIILGLIIAFEVVFILIKRRKGNL